MTETACVYTALFGDYEALNEQPVRRNSHLQFICFTNDPGLKSDSWEIVQAEPLFSMDPIRSQRQYKMLPHRFLPEYSVSLYIDNYNSDFHEWPIHQGRDRSRGIRSISASLVPAHLQLRHEVQAHHDTRQLLSQETEARGHVQELLSQEVGAHKRTLELLNDEIVSHACTRATLAEVMGSMSWRMTEPLRKLLYATTWSRGAIRWLLRRS